MSIEYKQIEQYKSEIKTEKLLADSPNYIKEFYNDVKYGKRNPATLNNYIRDIINFVEYEKNSLSHYKNCEIKDFPFNVIKSLTLKDMNEYRGYLRDIKLLKNASIKNIFSSISVFYNWCVGENLIDKSPLTNFEFPVVDNTNITKLSSEACNELLDGILRNDRLYIPPTDVSSSKIIKPTFDIRIKKEKFVLRNYAIVRLFLGSGMRVSELVGLDLSDINLKEGYANIVKKGDSSSVTKVYFNEIVSEAISCYLLGNKIDESNYDEYENKEKIITFIKENYNKDNYIELINKEFNYIDEKLKNKMLSSALLLSRSGRKGFNPKRNCNAVFLSSRGQRISVRSVEIMIKEMIYTYLPNLENKDKITPHKLRSTCATRILKQTGNIALASTQLNHKNITTTARFYAKMQEDEQKKQIQKLSVDEW